MEKKKINLSATGINVNDIFKHYKKIWHPAERYAVEHYFVTWDNEQSDAILLDVLIRHIFRQDVKQSGSPNVGDRLVSLNLSVVDVMQMYLFNVKVEDVELANDVIHVYEIAVCVVLFCFLLLNHFYIHEKNMFGLIIPFLCANLFAKWVSKSVKRHAFHHCSGLSCGLAWLVLTQLMLNSSKCCTEVITELALILSGCSHLCYLCLYQCSPLLLLPHLHQTVCR